MISSHLRRSQAKLLLVASDADAVRDFGRLFQRLPGVELDSRIERGRLTARGYHRVRRVARTLADLAGLVDGPIPEELVAQALTMRARIGHAKVGQAA